MSLAAWDPNLQTHAVCRFFSSLGPHTLPESAIPTPFMTTPTEPPKGPNCWQCQHFAISYVPSMPYACRAMGFQSQALPALEVLRADGQFCKLFLAKPKPVAQ